MAEASSFKRKIDVHAHHVPADFIEDLAAAGVSLANRPTPYPRWSVEMALEKYEKFGIATGILSIAPPGIHHGDDRKARLLARKVNESAADAVRQYPGRFGLFAELPLPDVDGAMAEIAYAFDTLHADGIALKTNARGIYLGDSRFDPVFDELNRRKALVFIHPISPACFEQCGLGYSPAMLEFPFDSARAVTNLILSGTLDRCRDLRLIVPHNGGVLPFLARRIALFGDQGESGRRAPQGVMSYLRRIHYDTAMSTTRHSLSSLRELVDISQIVYGSDWPLMPEAVVTSLNDELEQSRLFDDNERRAVYRGNAMRLLPRIAEMD
jgi:predicted TIM-barrel fold metal-dependent hydrolase